MDTHPTPVRVLNIISSGRSGSTVVGRVLGQMPGVFYAGELHPLWGPADLAQELCSCGERVLDCPVWSRALELTFSRIAPLDAASLYTLSSRYARVRHLLSVQFSVAHRARASVYADACAALIEALREVTGCNLIVDSSKMPAYNRLLAAHPRLQWHTLHLVRDPRAVAYSWTRRKAWVNADQQMVRQQGEIMSTRFWLMQNILIELLCRNRATLRLRYEDVVAAPGAALLKLAALTGQNWSRIEGNAIAVTQPSHAIGANPNRFESGNIYLQPDREWITRGAPRMKRVVALLAFPLLRRYGYPITAPDAE